MALLSLPSRTPHNSSTVCAISIQMPSEVTDISGDHTEKARFKEEKWMTLSNPELTNLEAHFICSFLLTGVPGVSFASP